MSLSAVYQELAKPFLFAQDPEDAHVRVLSGLAVWQRLGIGAELARSLNQVDDPRLHVRAFGVDFAAPVGLAAGLDKHAEAVRTWGWLGCGHAELGTITPRPQPGNPRPRLFRLPEDAALINRMGFNSLGAEVAAEHLRSARPYGLPIGINVGKNKDTPNEAAADDYVMAIEILRGTADWFTLNVSSPNTPDLRKLQEPAAMRALVAEAVAAAGAVPVLVKLAPDFIAGALEETVDAILQGGAAGLIASNTTLTRPGLRDATTAAEAGGLSGRPLRSLATQTVRRVYAQTQGKVPIIGVGGIETADDAWDKLLAGADLLQVYSAFIYRGPTLLHDLHVGLQARMDAEGVRNLRELVGQGTDA